MNRLKAAIATEDIDIIAQLTQTLPNFSSLQEMQEASHLLKAAISLLEHKKRNSLKEMEQLKKGLDFLNATHSQHKNSFDITS